MSAAPGGPAAHPRPRLRRACRLGAAGGRRADAGRGEGEPGSAAGEGYAARRAERRRAERRRRLLCFPRPDGPAGKGEAREGLEPAGATARGGGGGRGPRPARLAPPRRLPVPGGLCWPVSPGRGRRGWVSCPHKAAARVAGLELRLVLDRTRRAPLSGRSFVWAAGRAGALRYLPRPRFLSLPRMLRQPDPRGAGGSPEPQEVLRTQAAEVGVFHQLGRVKFENRLRA